MKVVAVIQARMGSTRLPGKVLKDIWGRPTLDWVVNAARTAKGVDEVIVATSTLPGDDAIVDWCHGSGVAVFRGSETDVLSRFIGAATLTGADVLIRLTGDCPFLDPRVISEVIKLRELKDVAYATNTDPPTYPDGLDVEVFTRDCLEYTNREATRRTDRDTVTRFMVRNRHRFPSANLVCPLPDLVNERWVLDSPEDYEFIERVAARLPNNGLPPSLMDILSVLRGDPSLKLINGKYARNERFYEDLTKEKAPRSYHLSNQWLKRAETLIPLGAQTFSKSKLMFPEGVTPLFVTHGDGGYVFDVDGNDYVDLVGGLLPNILGQRDPDVDAAIRDQLSRGISFSLATPLEEELAEKLNYHIPSAEMVRFGKNGSDVTTAAVRLARHITGRDVVILGGYHGWHDWSMANNFDRNAGIPNAAKADSIWTKNIPEPLYKRPDIAAIIVEPEFYSTEELTEIKRHCADHGIILIFDEIISGFRCGMGGLQQVTGVTPDLSTFGKAMANGMPISALVGKREFMSRMPEISFSGTFFGEALSLAASIATIDKLYALDVPGYLKIQGYRLFTDISALLDTHKVQGIKLHGPHELNRIKFDTKELQSLFIQEMARNGVLIIGSHNTCYAQKRPEFDQVIEAWDKTLQAIADGSAVLEGKVIQGKAVR